MIVQAVIKSIKNIN